MKSISAAGSVALAAALLASGPAWSGAAGPARSAYAASASRSAHSAPQPGGNTVRLLIPGATDQKKVLGRTYGEWAAQWVGWSFAGPIGQNVIEDPSGDLCALHQPPSRVWFLAGTFGGAAERSCTIPRGLALFYPLILTSWIDCPGTPDETLSDAEVRDILDIFAFSAPTELSTRLNDVPIASLQVPIVRTQTPAFTSVLPNGNVVTWCSAPPASLPAGRTGRQIADGYWVMLPALPPGQHTLTLRGAVPGFENSVTYRLTVR
jgi:hypothetical protein